MFNNGSYNYDVIKQRTDTLFDEIPCDANVSIVIVFIWLKYVPPIQIVKIVLLGQIKKNKCISGNGSEHFR